MAPDSLSVRIISHWTGFTDSRTRRYNGPVASCSATVSFFDHGNADGLSRAPSSPCRQCTRPDCPPFVSLPGITDQPTAVAGDSSRISPLQREDPTCITLHTWISSGEFPSWNEVMGLHPELRSLWHHHNNLSLDGNGIIWRKRSSQSSLLQLLVPKSGREQLFLAYHASLFGGNLGRNRTLARLAHRFYWSGMSDDVKEWLTQCVACVKENLRCDAIIPWEIFRLVTAGIASLWIFWMFATPLLRVTVTSW